VIMNSFFRMMAGLLFLGIGIAGFVPAFLLIYWNVYEWYALLPLGVLVGGSAMGAVGVFSSKRKVLVSGLFAVVCGVLGMILLPALVLFLRGEW